MEPIERSDTLADKAYESLRTALMSGTFKPGDSLSIRGLALTLGISATPARDAISRVLWERGLESGPHRTVIVPKLTRESLREIYDVRLSLEGLAAALAAPAFSEDDSARLQQVQREHLHAVETGDYKKALAANEAFHFSIYRRAGNATLLELISGLWLKLGPSLNLLYPTYDRTRQGVSHHEEIVEALRKRSARSARAAIEADLKDGWAELERAITQA